MAQVLVIDVKKDDVRIAECEELTDFYRELDADPFDIVRRKVGGTEYDIFVDNIGLFRDEQRISAVDTDGKPMLVGNLIFAHHDDEGNTTSLTTDDIMNIGFHACRVVMKDGTENMAIVCDY